MPLVSAARSYEKSREVHAFGFEGVGAVGVRALAFSSTMSRKKSSQPSCYESSKVKKKQLANNPLSKIAHRFQLKSELDLSPSNL